MRSVPASRPRITNPVSGSIYALDPDIPLDWQSPGVHLAGDIAGYRLHLGKRDPGAADSNIQIMPQRGSHILTRIYQRGEPMDGSALQFVRQAGALPEI